MNTLHHHAGSAALLRPLQRARMHPLWVAAAVAIILFCGVGVASMTGLLPNAFSQKDDAIEPAPAAAVGNAATAPAAAPSPLAARANPPAVRGEPAPVRQAIAACETCGTVESVKTVEVKGNGSGVGMVAGGVLGGLVGHQVGAGRGNTAMTVLGAAGGAFAGNEVEKHVKRHYSYRVTVRMDDGTYRTISQATAPSVASGDKVRISNGAIVARS